MRAIFQARRLLERVNNALFPGTLEFRAKIFTVLAAAGFLISVSAGLIGLANGAGAGNAAACGVAALLAAALLAYAKRSGRYRLCYGLTIAGVFTGLFPLVFFSAGGYHSGMPSFFIFAVIFTIFMLEGRAAVLTALGELLLYTGLCVYAYWRPGAVVFFKSEGALLADVIFGFVTVILALGATMLLQIRLYRNYQKELEAAREEALRLSRVKSAFLSHMSHEIRTPINVMLGMNELVLRTSEGEQEGYARAIEIAGKTLMALVNNVLDMSRLESGKMELHEGPYKTAELVRELFTMEQGMAERKGLTFTVEADENLPAEIVGDETRIKQVALNFLSNAFKYTEKGGVALRIRGMGDSGSFRLCIAVEDTGIGIREEQKADLFGPFTRLDTERQIEGSGLGLAIAKELAGLMGGSIVVESLWGRGSVFTAELPQLVLNAEPMGPWLAGERTAQRKAMRANNGAPKGRILVIDDDADFLAMTESFLEEDYETALALSAGRALEILAGGLSPDLILLDLSMPGMDGYETLRRINALDHTAGIPVMLVTGANETAAELRGLELGAVDYITKPFVKAILLKRLELHLKQGRELKTLRRERRKKKKPLPIPPLTPWERKIALLAQRRLSGGEIAGEMGTTDRTIRTALSSIYMKLDIHSKRELAGFDLELD